MDHVRAWIRHLVVPALPLAVVLVAARDGEPGEEGPFAREPQGGGEGEVRGVTPKGLPPASGDQIQVSVTDEGYQPADVTVPIRSMVAWRNEDDEEHTITFDELDVDVTLKPGEFTAWSFDAGAGVFTYHCRFHDDEQGQVAVSGTGADVPLTPFPGATPSPAP